MRSRSTKATLNADLTQNLQGVYTNPDPRTYPVSSYSYLIVPTTTAQPFTAAKGVTLSKFILYMVCAGQQEAAQLGYSPLPQNLVQDAFNVVQKIPGHVNPPPINQCDNPTIKGEFNTGNSPPPPPSDKEGSGGPPSTTPITSAPSSNGVETGLQNPTSASTGQATTGGSGGSGGTPSVGGQEQATGGRGRRCRGSANAHPGPRGRDRSGAGTARARPVAPVALHRRGGGRARRDLRPARRQRLLPQGSRTGLTSSRVPA